MVFLQWLGISPRDAPQLLEVTDMIRDSGQTFVFGRADSGERVDEKSAMQIATVYACDRLLAETVGGIPGASFFIMMNVIIKSSSGTIKRIYFLLN